MLQTLNKFIEQHGCNGRGYYFLGDRYSFAEVAATPFTHRARVALPVHRGYNLDKSVEQQGLTRLGAWLKVSHLHTLSSMCNAPQTYSVTYNIVSMRNKNDAIEHTLCCEWHGHGMFYIYQAVCVVHPLIRLELCSIVLLHHVCKQAAGYILCMLHSIVYRMQAWLLV